MPVRSDPQAATQKWVTNLSNSTTAITRGVQAVSVAPGAKAAAASGKWLAKVTQSEAKYKARVGSVSLSDWQTSMTQVGIPRIAQGATAKQNKMQSFMTDYLGYLNTKLPAIDAMPSNTLEDGINKAVAMIRANAGFKRSTSG